MGSSGLRLSIRKRKVSARAECTKCAAAGSRRIRGSGALKQSAAAERNGLYFASPVVRVSLTRAMPPSGKPSSTTQPGRAQRRAAEKGHAAIVAVNDGFTL